MDIEGWEEGWEPFAAPDPLVPGAHVSAPFEKGDRVLVVDGVCKGDVGAIVGHSQYTFHGEAVWFVQLDGVPYRSTIRETFLVPAPTASDDDVMAPHRNVRCP